MARRRYASDKPSEPPSPAPEPTPAPAQPPQPDTGTTGESSSLKAQLDAMRQQHQQPPPQQSQPDAFDVALMTHHPYLLGNITPSEYHYLRSRPHLMDPEQMQMLLRGFQVMHLHGIQRDTPEFFHGLDNLMHHGAAQHHAAQHDGAAPPEPEPVQHAPPEPPPEPVPTDQPAHMVAAPPSHGFVAGFEPQDSPNTIRLSAAEREHAKASGVSEEIYAKNKLKMMRAKKSGLIKD
jgi:hypothetical protein